MKIRIFIIKSGHQGKNYGKIMEITKDGFKTTKGTDGSICFLFDSNRSSESCDFALKNNIKKIKLYPNVYFANNLDPILPLSDYLEGLLLDDRISYDNLDVFKNLTFLSVPDNKRNFVDLSCFEKLETLSCDYSKRILNLDKCMNLKSLSIGNYNPTSMDLSEFPTLINIVKLRLFRTNILTLKGVEKLTSLKEIGIYGASKLTKIESLKFLSNSLKEIQIEKCKHISDYNILGELISLKKIILSESGEIKNLSFIENLSDLRFFSFWGTNILDGNLNYCSGIDYVGFDDKKHYSHKSGYFKAKRI